MTWAQQVVAALRENKRVLVYSNWDRRAIYTQLTDISFVTTQSLPEVKPQQVWTGDKQYLFVYRPVLDSEFFKRFVLYKHTGILVIVDNQYRMSSNYVERMCDTIFRIGNKKLSSVLDWIKHRDVPSAIQNMGLNNTIVAIASQTLSLEEVDTLSTIDILHHRIPDDVCAELVPQISKIDQWKICNGNHESTMDTIRHDYTTCNHTWLPTPVTDAILYLETQYMSPFPQITIPLKVTMMKTTMKRMRSSTRVDPRDDRIRKYLSKIRRIN